MQGGKYSLRLLGIMLHLTNKCAPTLRRFWSTTRRASGISPGKSPGSIAEECWRFVRQPTNHYSGHKLILICRKWSRKPGNDVVRPGSPGRSQYKALDRSGPLWSYGSNFFDARPTHVTPSGSGVQSDVPWQAGSKNLFKAPPRWFIAMLIPCCMAELRHDTVSKVPTRCCEPVA
jgi:hypothetical protein